MRRRKYELPLTRDYVSNWSMPDAIRELIQNALDSESPFEWSLEGRMLQIKSRKTTLQARTLLLGATDKHKQKDTIGNFGEGYKLALLVLAREGYEVLVANGEVEWVPDFTFSETFGEEILVIKETQAEYPHEGLTFYVKLNGEEDEAHMRACCLQMQDNIGEIIETKYGRILLDRKGELYVGSLYICKTQLEYGYDILPQHISLERDRQTVSTWDLQYKTKEMWLDAERMDKLIELIEGDVPDVEYVAFNTPEIVKDACYKHFQKKYPDSIVAESQEELNKMIEDGMERVVVIGGTMGPIIRNSAGYQSRRVRSIRSPYQILESWIEEWCPEVNPQQKDLILHKAKTWRHK